MRKIYGSDKNKSKDFLDRKNSVFTEISVYGQKPIFLKKVEIKFEKKEQNFKQFNMDEKSRLIPNENK